MNTYRAMSGLGPVTANATWSAEAQAHSCYMLQNGISHDEIVGKPGYTAGGDVAGNSGNVAVSSSINAKARNHIDLWMTGPFHAIGILRYSLRQSGFGLCTNSNTTPWKSGGTLDVIRGIDSSIPRPSTPITFPGNGATVPLNSFITEFPNPMTLCGWSGSAGLPLIAMMPNKVSNASATINGPNGPIETCVLHAGNTGADGTARAILDGDNAVVVMPRTVLPNGSYSVAVDSNGGAADWQFVVDTSAGLAANAPKLPDTRPSAAPVNFEPVDPFRLVDTRKGQGTTRIQAKSSVRITAATADVAAVSANFVAVRPSAPGHLTIYNCSSKVPEVSTLGYTPGTAIANQAIVPLDKGDFCVYAHASVDVVIDVNGYYRPSADASEFTPIDPKRLYDSRPGKRLAAGEERKIRVTGTVGGPPVGADAVALNVTAIRGSNLGHLQIYPCGATNSLETSTINYQPNEARPNSVVVGTDDQGQVCAKALTDLDIAIDVTGYFDDGAGYEFTALNPIRLFDSRKVFSGLNEVTSGQKVRAGQIVKLQIAGERGIPGDAKAASVNVTVTQPDHGLHVTVFPCGKQPTTSNVNAAPGQTVANGAMVKLSGSGQLCVTSLKSTHLIVDINGVWS
ncbi:MAG: hypothetical protein CL424_15565 [Acidimicrobiaceae bacterium]|nr:hypothetical protein [Acidimicrobiaceae bacterium]